MRRTWAEYKRLQRRRDWLKHLVEQEQDMQRQQVEKGSQYLADLGTLQRDISEFNHTHKVRSKLVADILQLGGSESVGESTPLLIQHDRMIHEHQRNLQDHQSEHVSLQAHEELKAQFLDLQEAYADLVEVVDRMYQKLYGKSPDEAGA